MKTITKIIYTSLATFVLACITVLPPNAFGVTPTPDGGYPGGNTAEGQNALLSLSGGTYNTAVGMLSLESLTTGTLNTAIGAATLIANTGDENTATGAAALLSNTIGGSNTAAGAFALLSNTIGDGNTAVGNRALLSNTTASSNTAIGGFALSSNIASFNTATGFAALSINTTGTRNTADGTGVLADNVSGNDNTATGDVALASNTGNGNTATGSHALFNNTGDANTAVGFNALAGNTTVGGLGANTAVGADALEANTIGADNVGVGLLALSNNSTGNANTALGAAAGAQITGNNNTDIGQAVAGVAGESNTTRIGNSSVTATYISGIFGQSVFQGTTVLVDSTGKLGTVTSSRRFKQDIQPMDKSSEALLGLQPVTFRYKKEIDPHGMRQFGLVAEEVEKVSPDLVVHDKEGKPYTVRYDQVNAMLLNEFLKGHKKVEAQQATIAELKSMVVQQQKQFAKQDEEIQALTCGLQKVNAQLQRTKDAPRIVANHP